MSLSDNYSPAEKRRNRLVALAVLVVALAILAALFSLLYIDSDWAAAFAAGVLLLAGLAIWAVLRHPLFGNLRQQLRQGFAAGQARQRDLEANPHLPPVRRQARWIGLVLIVVGLILCGVFALIVMEIDSRIYIYMIAIPAALFLVGLWMLVTGRHPKAPKRR